MTASSVASHPLFVPPLGRGVDIVPRRLCHSPTVFPPACPRRRGNRLHPLPVLCLCRCGDSSHNRNNNHHSNTNGNSNNNNNSPNSLIISNDDADVYGGTGMTMSMAAAAAAASQTPIPIPFPPSLTIPMPIPIPIPSLSSLSTLLLSFPSSLFNSVLLLHLLSSKRRNRNNRKAVTRLDPSTGGTPPPPPSNSPRPSHLIDRYHADDGPERCRLCGGHGTLPCTVCDGRGVLRPGGFARHNPVRVASLVGSKWTSVAAINGKWRHFLCVAKRGSNSKDGVAVLSSTCGPVEKRVRIDVPVKTLRARSEWMAGWTTMKDIRAGAGDEDEDEDEDDEMVDGDEFVDGNSRRQSAGISQLDVAVMQQQQQQREMTSSTAVVRERKKGKSRVTGKTCAACKGERVTLCPRCEGLGQIGL